MDSYCSPYSEGELFFLILIPLGLIVLSILFFIAYKLHATAVINKSLKELSLIKTYLIGIPFVFSLAFNAIYSSPGTFSATGSETISDPLFRAIYITSLFAIFWPPLFIGGIIIDSLLLGVAIYYPFKVVLCGNFVTIISSFNPFQVISFFLSPFNLFFNGPLYYMLLLVVIVHFKQKSNLKVKNEGL